MDSKSIKRKSEDISNRCSKRKLVDEADYVDESLDESVDVLAPSGSCDARSEETLQIFDECEDILEVSTEDIEEELIYLNSDVNSSSCDGCNAGCSVENISQPKPDHPEISVTATELAIERTARFEEIKELVKKSLTLGKTEKLVKVTIDEMIVSKVLRDVDRSTVMHYAQLFRSKEMLSTLQVFHGFWKPSECKYMITDGQHRLEALRHLNENEDDRKTTKIGKISVYVPISNSGEQSIVTSLSTVRKGSHGLPYTESERIKHVIMMRSEIGITDEEIGKASDNELREIFAEYFDEKDYSINAIRLGALGKITPNIIKCMKMGETNTLKSQKKKAEFPKFYRYLLAAFKKNPKLVSRVLENIVGQTLSISDAQKTLASVPWDPECLLRSRGFRSPRIEEILNHTGTEPAAVEAMTRIDVKKNRFMRTTTYIDKFDKEMNRILSDTNQSEELVLPRKISYLAASDTNDSTMFLDFKGSEHLQRFLQDKADGELILIGVSKEANVLLNSHEATDFLANFTLLLENPEINTRTKFGRGGILAQVLIRRAENYQMPVFLLNEMRKSQLRFNNVVSMDIFFKFIASITTGTPTLAMSSSNLATAVSISKFYEHVCVSNCCVRLYESLKDCTPHCPSMKNCTPHAETDAV